jgi:hypothetical protein
MPAITSGALLTKKLAETGTGEAKLAIARKCLIDARDAGRAATAAEVVAALELGGAPDMTVLKAKALAETGEWHGPPADVNTPVEEELLKAEGIELPEPAAELGPDPAPAPKPAKKK